MQFLTLFQRQFAYFYTLFQFYLYQPNKVDTYYRLKMSDCFSWTYPSASRYLFIIKKETATAR